MNESRSGKPGAKRRTKSVRRKTSSAFPAPPRAQSAGGLDWLEVWYALREKWKTFLLCFFVAMAGGAGYYIYEPKLYSAKAIIQVEEQGQQIVNVKEVLPEDFRTSEMLKTVEQALTSRTLAKRVVRMTKLMEDPTYGEPGANKKYPESKVLDILIDRCDFKLRKGTRMVDLTVDDTDPERARLLAMAFITEFKAENLDQREEVTGSANEFLVKESERLRAKLQKSDQALQDYREKYGAVSLEDRQNIVSEKLKDLNRSVTQAKSARIKFEADYEAIKNAKGAPYRELLSLPTVASLPEVSELMAQINTKEAAFAQLKERYLELHPMYIQAQGQLRELRLSIERAVAKAGETVRNLHETAIENETRLSKALHEQEQVSLELSKLSIPYNVLQREMEADRTLFESVLARLKEMKLAQGAEKTNIRVIQAPFLPTFVEKPRRMRVLAVSILCGLVLGGGVVSLLKALDTSMQSVDQAEETFGMPCLAVVPESKFTNLDRCLVLMQDPATAEAEGIRSLRTSLSLLMPEAKPQVLLFTSALPSEGKSFIAANYASALAEQGRRTLLIDADLRRPGLGFIFSKAMGAKGLSDYLSGHESFDEVHHPLGIDNLSIIPAGQRSANPAELFAAGRFASLLDAAAAHYDCIVIDSAPVNLVSDTLLLVKHAPMVCLVMRARKTPARTLARACHLLQMAECSPVGFVLNRMPQGPSSNYYSYYEGEYGSAGVYGAKERSTGRSV